MNECGLIMKPYLMVNYPKQPQVKRRFDDLERKNSGLWRELELLYA